MTPAEKTTTDFTYKLKYAGDKTNYAQDGSGWTVDKSSYLAGEKSTFGKILYVTNKYTVTYTDGVDGTEVFPDQTYSVVSGSEIPAFDGTPERSGYTFTGWAPEVSGTVTADVTYIAQWQVNEPEAPSGSNSLKELFKFHCTEDEGHADQTYNWFGSYVKYNGDMAYDAERGVYTATANITNVQTLLSTGVNAPEKVWGTITPMKTAIPCVPQPFTWSGIRRLPARMLPALIPPDCGCPMACSLLMCGAQMPPRLRFCLNWVEASRRLQLFV